ncbi:hypothetical protein B484DRAFT_451108 [Ochromonadaceae sp. CCMP2298]|nr:hypothetical protein B484DRAFT_451108 [Ochromonadaceae sp. CCMP2298]
MRAYLIALVLTCVLTCVQGFRNLGASRYHGSSKVVYQAKTPLVAGGKRFEAEPGSSLIVACTKLGLKVPTQCRKGDCGTCTVTVAGQKIRSCVGKVPPAPRLKSLQEKGLAVSVDNGR